MKNLICGICVVVFVLNILNLSVCAHIKPDEISISDFSGVISDGVKDYVKSRNNTLYSHTQAKIIFVTTNTMDGLSANEYTKKLYSSWNIGSVGRGNSVLVVMSPNLKDYGIIQGKSIQRIMTDEFLSEIMAKDFEPYFSKAEYDDAVLNLYNKLGKWYEENYNGLSIGISDNFEIYKTGNKTADTDKKPDRTWLWVSSGVMALVIIVFFNIKKHIDFKARQTERRIKRKRSKADIDKIVNS